MFKTIEEWIRTHSAVLEITGTWFSGIATLLAVGFALHLQRRIERRVRPRVTLHATSASGSCIRYLDPDRITSDPANAGQPRREELWLRLWLQNDSPTVARDVTLKLVTVEKDGVLENRPKWPFKLSNLDGTSVDILPRGFDQPVDIAYLRNVEGVDEDAQLALVLVNPPQLSRQQEKARIERAKFHQSLQAGPTYNLTFVALSSNADATYFKMTVSEKERPGGPLDQLLGESRLRARLRFTPPQLDEPSRFKRLMALTLMRKRRK